MALRLSSLSEVERLTMQDLQSAKHHPHFVFIRKPYLATRSSPLMSKGDASSVQSKAARVLEHARSHHEIYQTLRRRSTSLAWTLLVSLPALLLFFNIACTPWYSIGESLRRLPHSLTLNFDCLAIVLGWLLLHVGITSFVKHRDGNCTRTPAMHDGLIALVVSLAGIYLLDRLNVIRGAYVCDHMHSMLLAAIVVAFAISVLLYIKGSDTRREKGIHPVVAFVYGTDVNLTVAGIDLRAFLELRAGLIGWACLNLCFWLKAMQLHTYRRPPACAMVVIEQMLQAFQLVWYDDGRLARQNAKAETVGFLRVFGSLCWFPFLW